MFRNRQHGFAAPCLSDAKGQLRVHFDPCHGQWIDAKVVDSGENLIVLIPDDGGVLYRLDASANRAPCTNAVQTYVDLVKAGGRGEEAAEAILNQRLKPAWVGAQ